MVSWNKGVTGQAPQWAAVGSVLKEAEPMTPPVLIGAGAGVWSAASASYSQEC